MHQWTGFLPFVDEPLLDEAAERARDRRLILEVHRQVRIVPRAENAEPLELLGHRADEALGVRAARAAEVRDRHLALLRAELAIDLQLDRQSMTVVAHHVRARRSRPSICDLTTRSFRILFIAVPMWMLPFAYGGPSCSTNFGAPRRCRRIFPYRSMAVHRASASGSVTGRFAFIGKPVRGRLTVSFHSGMGIQRFIVN